MRQGGIFFKNPCTCMYTHIHAHIYQIIVQNWTIVWLLNWILVDPFNYYNFHSVYNTMFTLNYTWNSKIGLL